MHAFASFGYTCDMQLRRSEYDVINTIKVTDTQEVSEAVCRLYGELYPRSSTAELEQAFVDIDRLFHGRYPGYLGCETPYHDLQHTLDVTLAMMRLISGYENSQPTAKRIGSFGGLLGLISALFHDTGYMRKRMDRHHANGAEYTRIHVSRGGRFRLNTCRRWGLAEPYGHVHASFISLAMKCWCPAFR